MKCHESDVKVHKFPKMIRIELAVIINGCAVKRN